MTASRFQADTVSAAEIRKEANYAGVRVTLLGLLDGARCPVEAMASLGILNSRMKDYFDLWMLARHCEFDGAVLAQAVRATFERRGTGVPAGLPLGLTDEFALDGQKIKQWQAFQRKNALEPMPLTVVIGALGEFLLPVLSALVSGSDRRRQWRPAAGWDAS